MREENMLEAADKDKSLYSSGVLYLTIKFFIDIIGAVFGTLLLIPITIFVKLSYILTGDFTSIFFTQIRVGKNGRAIKIYKYRSMVKNADQVLEKMMNEDPDIYWEYKRYKKLHNDPRITKVGRFIRSTSIDEFPQFLNVLIGEMSLVGPRPYLPKEIKDMGEYYNTIVTCKPGITGYWQVNGRSGTDFIKRLVLDEYYCHNKNTFLDIKILIKTVVKVFIKDGAQ